MIPQRARSLVVLTFLAMFTSGAAAQSLFHDTAFYFPHDSSAVMGRSVWFAPPELFGQSTAATYYELNITSPKNTIAHIHVANFDASVSVQAGKTAAYALPLTQVIKTSGIVEDKGYHVWSDSADLDLMLTEIQTADSAGDGIHLLPDFQLGRDYIVAGYEAYFYGSSSDEFDYPSLFTIVAEHDSTLVTITPSADLREETESAPNPSAVAHPKGQTFTESLNKGQSVQYKTVIPQNPTDYDVTGTVLHSNYPIAVIGGCQRAQIPATYAKYDFVADMVPPIRSWGRTYYSVPFFQAPGITDHDASTFVVIGSQAGQTINIVDQTGDHAFCTLDHAFDLSSASDISGPAKWYSSAPFLLTQYMNGADYPSQETGTSGSPAMAVLTPAELFGNSATIQVPLYNASFTTQFAPYVNIIVNANAKSVTFDGASIGNWTKKPISGEYTVYRNPIGAVQPGSHRIESDLPVGAYAYAYATHTGQSITYPASPGLLAAAGNDQIPPVLSWNETNGCDKVTISDAGSGISYIEIDSLVNLTISGDPTFIPGDSTSSTTLTACLADASKAAFARFTAYDMTGNRSVGEISYSVPSTTLKPGFTMSATNFDTVQVGTSKTIASIVLNDTSSAWPITFDSIWSDNPAFRDGMDALPITLNSFTSDTLHITFSPVASMTYSGTFHVRSTSAGTRTVQLQGKGYATDGVMALKNNTLSILPESDGIRIALHSDLNPTARFTLLNILGAPVLHAFVNGNNQVIPTSLLARDIYFYHLVSGDQVWSGKIVIGE